MPQTKGNNMSTAKQIQDLKAELKKLQETEVKKSVQVGKYKLTFKVGQKGTINIYGMGRFPTCLYPEQLKALLSAKQELLDFIEQNVKDEQNEQE